MADTVQYLMEKMIPELVDMERRGYFSRAEIKKIVQKRQDFEYLLKRRTALKEDYYRFVTTSWKQRGKVRQVVTLALGAQVHRVRDKAGRIAPIPQAKAAH